MYKYETHLHTAEASACAVSYGMEYPEYYKAMGYSGIFVTDHFFNGHTCIPDNLSWEKRVNEFCKGYEHAKEIGDKIGLSVFFGWEANFEGDEFLIYGLDKDWLLNHPDILSWSRTRQYDMIHSSGGLVVQAHPFRERDYLSAVRLNPDTVDAWEAYNAFNEPYQNYNAQIYCREHDIFMTAGSDIHKTGSLPEGSHFGMEFNHQLKSPADYVKAILNREGEPVVPEKSRLSSVRSSELSKIHTSLPIIINHREN